MAQANGEVIREVETRLSALERKLASGRSRQAAQAVQIQRDDAENRVLRRRLLLQEEFLKDLNRELEATRERLKAQENETIGRQQAEECKRSEGLRREQDARAAAEAANARLENEIRFLKADIGTRSRQADTLLACKSELEAMLKAKDAEIAGLFARFSAMENEKEVLEAQVQFLLRRRHHHASASREHRGSLLRHVQRWLSRPLITVRTY